MSKLDWFTILIITICILAIGALLYNTQQIISKDKNPQQERTEDYHENDTSGEYDVNIDGDSDGDDVSNVNASPSAGGERIYSPEETETANDAAARAARELAAEDEVNARTEAKRREANTTKTNTSPTKRNTSAIVDTATASDEQGRYLVLIGSYTQMISAERMQRMLRDKGYQNTDIKLFDNGKYARVLVGKRKTLNSAKDLQAELVSDGFRDVLIKAK